MSLKNKAMQMNAGQGIPFMEGRTKGEVKDLYDQEVVIKDFGYINGEDGDYLVFIVEDNEKEFFFGASVITDSFKKFDEEDVAEIRSEGLPTKLYERKNKKGNRTYQAVEFYPNEEIPF
jgi:hypothetical protein